MKTQSGATWNVTTAGPSSVGVRLLPPGQCGLEEGGLGPRESAYS